MQPLDAVTGDHDHEHGGDTKEQIAAYRETLTDFEQADYLVSFTLKPKRILKRVISDSKKGGYGFDRNERADEMEEMYNGGAFTDIELDTAAMEVLFTKGGEQEQKGEAGC